MTDRVPLPPEALALLRQLLAGPPAIPERPLARVLDCVKGDEPGVRDRMGALTLDSCLSDPGENGPAFAARAVRQLFLLRERWNGGA